MTAQNLETDPGASTPVERLAAHERLSAGRLARLMRAFTSHPQGGVLNVVFAAPEGERLDTPERREAVEAAGRP
jgi:hypothetical protein